jgi:predicted AAA+ superfamily ATPase
MKNANEAVGKWQTRAGSASTDYADGASSTTKDQAQSAIAAKTVYQQALTESFGRDAYAKGLGRSGKQGWLKGVQEKGQQNYSTGVSANSAREKYVTNSSKYDSARNAANSLPRGARGSAGNLARVAAVANALRAVKVGK